MDGDFLRRVQQPRWLKGITKKVFKTRRRALFVIVGTLLVSYILFNNRGIITRIRLEHQRLVMIEKVRAADEETKRLQSYLKALDGDKKTIEKVAREKYGMARDGETVYKVNRVCQHLVGFDSNQAALVKHSHWMESQDIWWRSPPTTSASDTGILHLRCM
jgi:cell division protein FtsB